MTAYVFDTECTGIDDPEIIQAAYYPIGEPRFGYDFPLGIGWSELRKPTKRIEWGAIATHHIFPSELEGKPPSSEFELPEDCEYLIGHNIDFDYNAIKSRSWYPKIKRICTYAISQHLFLDADSYSLVALVYMCLGESMRDYAKNAHNASTDCIITAHLLNEIAKRLGVKTFEELWHISEQCRIPRIISFGKHKGTPLEKIPSDYINWYLRQPEQTDKYLSKGLTMVRNGSYKPPKLPTSVIS